MEVEKNGVLTEVDETGSLCVVEKSTDSSHTVDDESDSHHKTADDLSDDVTLAAADSTSPEVDTNFEWVRAWLHASNIFN